MTLRNDKSEQWIPCSVFLGANSKKLAIITITITTVALNNETTHETRYKHITNISVETYWKHWHILLSIKINHILTSFYVDYVPLTPVWQIKLAHSRSFIYITKIVLHVKANLYTCSCWALEQVQHVVILSDILKDFQTSVWCKKINKLNKLWERACENSARELRGWNKHGFEIKSWKGSEFVCSD